MRSMLFVGCFLLLGCSAFSQANTGGATFKLFQSGQLPDTMGRHGSCIIGTRLYIIGGEDNVGRRQKTYSAEILPTGMLGTWREETSLPEKRAGIQNALTVVNNRIYIVGGMGTKPKGKGGFERFDSIVWTEVKPDGTLGAWQSGGTSPSKRRAGYVVTSDDTHVFVQGGKGPDPVDDMMSAAVYPDGSIPAWQNAGKLPIPLADHGTVVMDGRMYVWGGITVGAARQNKKVFSAPVANGNVGAWREETSLPGNAYETVCVGHNDYLLAIGGRDTQKQPCQLIWQTRLNQTQVPGWNNIQTDLAGQLFMSAAIDRTRGWVFVTGGRDATGAGDDNGPSAGARPYVNTIQGFRLTQPETSKLHIASSQQGAAPTAGNLPNLPTALAQAASSGRPVLVLLYSPEVPSCKRFWDAVMTSPDLNKVQQAAILAAIDVSVQPDALKKFGIFRLPALVTLKSDGSMVNSKTNVRTMADLKTVLQLP